MQGDWVPNINSTFNGLPNNSWGSWNEINYRQMDSTYSQRRAQRAASWMCEGYDWFTDGELWYKEEIAHCGLKVGFL